ncbi:unnamed protein product [Meganyctiphanes norvegica]|uniref:Phosphatidylinositide phosphatase SAC2 n=1 Tax=Meganyctiphanes norvegica TaxID=48144 RepID=A0AAV2QJB0_MEGNR
MEVLQTDDYYILNKGQNSLWCDRRSGEFEAKTCWDLATAGNPICLGMVHLLIGKIQVHPDVSPRLVLASGVRNVGSLSGGHPVYCISRVVFLPLWTQPDQDLSHLQPCQKHSQLPSGGAGGDKRVGNPFGDLQQKVSMSKTFGTLKSVTSTIKTATVNVAATAALQSNKARRDVRNREQYEKRILDELSKMFNDSDCFYFSFEADVTSSIQRQTDPSYNSSLPLWRRAEDAFFWNKHMLIDLINSENPGFDMWITPVIQGFIQIEPVPLDVPVTTPDDSSHTNNSLNTYILSVVSRRSRFRAGTRYKRRGVDEDGHVANYVETEQIVSYSHHQVAFVQVRGSVPVYWSQPGYKYRPPPTLDKGPTETAIAFAKHMEGEINHFNQIVCLSLVEHQGKEKVIADAYLNNILTLNSENITFVTFDFHEYCRGMRYENVSVLLESIEDITNKMLYCWVDREGTICRQNGVFRINCIDCLDRTNVVQTAFAKSVLENQIVKLGMIPPEHPLPDSCRNVLQTMWANNGDVISKQYAGTSALKGDFTRTGERRFAGMMKDGMNSANRYYLNRFKDAYRQHTMDRMLGNPITEDMLTMNPADMGGGEEEATMTPEHVKHVIDDCKKLLVPEAQHILGAWGLIDADPVTGDPDQTDMDIILVLTKDSYYVATYDEETDQIERYERVSLIDLEKIEMGAYTCQGVFKQSRVQHCIRFNYAVDGQSGYFHMLRSMNIRFFNNMAVTVKSEEEVIESVKAIGETFEVAVQMIGCEVELVNCKIEKKRSRGRSNLANPLNLLTPITTLTKTSPDSLKNAGTRAFSNVTSGLAKLNPINSLRNKRPSNADQIDQPVMAHFYVQKPSDSSSTRYHRSILGISEVHLTSCGTVASSLQPMTPPMTRRTSSPGTRCRSDSSLNKVSSSAVCEGALRSATPEIFVSATSDSLHAASATPTVGGLSPSLFMQRVRKISHSSDEVDVRDDRDDTQFLRASSTTGLNLHLPSSHSEGHINPGASNGETSNLVSPLGAINKETMLAPFSMLARGVKSLAPGAGKLAQGVQNIGTSFDARKLRNERQRQLEQNGQKEEIQNCKTKIIQL